MFYVSPYKDSYYLDMDMFAHGITCKEQLISEDTKAEYLMKRNEALTAAIADKKVKYNKCVVHPSFFPFPYGCSHKSNNEEYFCLLQQ